MWKNGRILFIVNPNSGWHNGSEFSSILDKVPKFKGVEYDVAITERAGHANEIAAKAILSKNHGAVVAVGGDGTVNEVASALVNSETPMGVIPMGRGNGFARHLGYSMRVRHALKQLVDSSVDEVDVMTINGKYSFNVSGIGFDALVAHVAAHTKVKGIFSYIWAVITHFFKYRAHTYKVTIDGNVLQVKAFLLSFANTDQYGNNFIIAPRASIKDGVMELCIIDSLRNVFWAGLDYTRYFLMENNANTHSFRMFHCKDVTIEGKINIVHIDGEPMYMHSPLNIKVLPNALKVLVPKPDQSGI